MGEQAKYKGWQRVLLIIFPYLFIVGLFQVIGGFLVGFDFTNMDAQSSPEQKITIYFFSFAGTILVVWLFVRSVDKIDFIDIGLHIKNRIKDFWAGFWVGTLIMVVGFVVLQLLDEIRIEEVHFSLSELIGSILLFLFVSLAEEILLRGYVLRNLMYSFNKYFALILSSVLFSLMHGFNPNIDILGLINIFLAGMLLGITYIHTKNLWFPIALHFSWNFFQAMLGFNVSGQNLYSVVKVNMKEDTLLNGGAFGFEGSILSSFAMLLSVIAIIIYFSKTRPSLATYAGNTETSP